MGALGNLVAGVSHEINTPIGIGVTAISYLDQKTEQFQSLYETGKMKKSDLEQFLAVIRETNEMVHTNLERASSLVRSFKQISIDQSIEEKRSFHMKEYLEGIVTSLKPTLKKTKLRVDVYCSPDLVVYTYPGALSQIITNLVMNSLNHAFAPNEEGSLSLRVTQTQDQISIAYTDDGKGMNQEVLDKIFDPFFTTSRGRGGTGLGMNIVYNLVTQSLNGTITCSSTLGLGSLFMINIPKEEEIEL
ncbi:sensor histidine kinase [Paenibacillus sp. N3.4]|uniref:sensor histidine kinase n=1 Tax=Paenibacillus sp. N3.4 TaxID=2603222 RepID=UPI0011C75745|nr:HAMP domain-containing sensor histidine kinase [Paenibacillus sp. N3.4]TXK71808.1 HAMP domain-containing histidine kinase [Paenibacillus sp. N3.4]